MTNVGSNLRGISAARAGGAGLVQSFKKAGRLFLPPLASKEKGLPARGRSRAETPVSSSHRHLRTKYPLFSNTHTDAAPLEEKKINSAACDHKRHPRHRTCSRAQRVGGGRTRGSRNSPEAKRHQNPCCFPTPPRTKRHELDDLEQ